jgi:hypothetical protein
VHKIYLQKEEEKKSMMMMMMMMIRNKMTTTRMVKVFGTNGATSKPLRKSEPNIWRARKQEATDNSSFGRWAHTA